MINCLDHVTAPLTRWVLFALGFVVTAILLQATVSKAADDGTFPANASLYAKPTDVKYPSFNKPSAAKQALGEKLFFDPRLSGGNTMSCHTCHKAEHAWADGQSFSTGETGVPSKRRTPPLQDIAWEVHFGRDGRGDSLEGFVLGPIVHKDIMNQSLEDLPGELANDPEYLALFLKAFDSERVVLGGITQGLATYMRSLTSGTASFDRWVAGDPSAVSEPAKNGFALFNGKARCGQCHTGWRFTDQLFHDIGLHTKDKGRGTVDPTDEKSLFAFKTPSLRNVSLRAPYMHNGSMSTLDEVVDHYRSGIEFRSSLSPKISAVILSPQEKLNLIEFLKTLTDDTRR